MMVCLCGAAFAQTPMPEIPESAQCDTMANKTGRLGERYPTLQFYFGCVVAESVPTLLLEANTNLESARKWSSRTVENTPAEEFQKALRTAAAEANTGLYAAQYAEYFLRANTLDYYGSHDRLLKLAGVNIDQANTINQIIALKYTQLDARYPALELPRLEGQLATLKYCEAMYANYESGKIKEVERNFLFPQTYRDRVVVCAGVGINFYDLLRSSRFTARANQKFRRSCEENPDEWKALCGEVLSED